MRVVSRYLLSLGVIVFFSLISVYLPPWAYSWVVLAYLVTFMAINMVVVGISARRLLRDLEYVSGGRVLFEETKRRVQLLKRKDRKLEEESRSQLRSQAKSMLGLLLTFVVIMVLFGTPQMRNLVVSVPKELIMGFVSDEKAALFLSYLLFYLLLMVASTLVTKPFGAGGVQETLVVPSEYVVTERGLIIDNSIAYRFPLRAKGLNVSPSRRYVELVLSGAPALRKGGVTSRVRLYTSKFEELYKILKSNVVLEG